MCAESVPWKCHRLLVSNELNYKGIDVYHITGINKFIKHETDKFGATTALMDGRVVYPKNIWNVTKQILQLLATTYPLL